MSPGNGVTNPHRMLARPKRREYRPAVEGEGGVGRNGEGKDGVKRIIERNRDLDRQ